MKKKRNFPVTDDQMREVATAALAASADVALSKLIMSPSVDHALDPHGGMRREAKRLYDNWVVKWRRENRPEATRVVVDGEVVWESEGAVCVPSLRYDWNDDGLVIVDLDAEAARRDAIERLQDPAPSTWQSLTPVIAAAAGGMMYRYGAAIASQVATRAKK